MEQKKKSRQKVYTLLVQVGRKDEDGLPAEATGAALMCYASGIDEAEALKFVTLNPAIQLGIDDRVGSLEVGKDGDVALYDGDPFEYTSHCVGVIIDGEVVSEQKR